MVSWFGFTNPFSNDTDPTSQSGMIHSNPFAWFFTNSIQKEVLKKAFNSLTVTQELPPAHPPRPKKEKSKSSIPLVPPSVPFSIYAPPSPPSTVPPSLSIQLPTTGSVAWMCREGLTRHGSLSSESFDPFEEDEVQIRSGQVSKPPGEKRGEKRRSPAVFGRGRQDGDDEDDETMESNQGSESVLESGEISAVSSKVMAWSDSSQFV